MRYAGFLCRYHIFAMRWEVLERTIVLDQSGNITFVHYIQPQAIFCNSSTLSADIALRDSMSWARLFLIENATRRVFATAWQETPVHVMAFVLRHRPSSVAIVGRDGALGLSRLSALENATLVRNLA